MKATSKCIYPKCAVVTVANHRNQVVKVELKLEAYYKLIQLYNCKKGTYGAKLLKIYVYLSALDLARIYHVRQVVSYPLQAVNPTLYFVAILSEVCSFFAGIRKSEFM